MISGDTMPSYESFDLNTEKERAAQRLRELNARSKYKSAAQCAKEQNAENKPPDFLGNLGIPVLSNLKLDSDILLIAGILLILSAEKSDKLLLLALLYIVILILVCFAFFVIMSTYTTSKVILLIHRVINIFGVHKSLFRLFSTFFRWITRFISVKTFYA